MAVEYYLQVKLNSNNANNWELKAGKLNPFLISDWHALEKNYKMLKEQWMRLIIIQFIRQHALVYCRHSCLTYKYNAYNVTEISKEKSQLVKFTLLTKCKIVNAFYTSKQLHTKQFLLHLD